MSLAGLALAGGKSSRMGRNKALLKPWGRHGPTLLEHTCALLGSVCGVCVISCQAGQRYAGFSCVPDTEATYGGPACGVAAGLAWAAEHNYDGVLALACDMPDMQPWLLQRLAAAARKYPKAWAVCFAPAGAGKLEMLVAVYRVEFLPVLQAGLASGESSLYRLVPAERRKLINYGANEASHFRNCNTPADLAACCKLFPDSFC